MIALHRLRGCQLCFLSSGHSHEDVDAYFALVSSWFDRQKELWGINDFQQCLQAFLANKSVRAHEPHRSVVVFDLFHDWILGNKSDEILFFHFLRVCNFHQSHHLLFSLSQEASLRALRVPCAPQRNRRSTLVRVGSYGCYKLGYKSYVDGFLQHL